MLPLYQFCLTWAVLLFVRTVTCCCLLISIPTASWRWRRPFDASNTNEAMSFTSSIGGSVMWQPSTRTGTAHSSIISKSWKKVKRMAMLMRYRDDDRGVLSNECNSFFLSWDFPLSSSLSRAVPYIGCTCSIPFIPLPSYLPFFLSSLFVSFICSFPSLSMCTSVSKSVRFSSTRATSILLRSTSRPQSKSSVLNSVRKC